MNLSSPRALAAILTLVAAATAAGAAPGDLEKLGWLAGCWESVGAEPGSVEQWMPLAGATMLGMSRTIKNGQTQTYEFMQLRDLRNGTQRSIEFPMTRVACDAPK